LTQYYGLSKIGVLGKAGAHKVMLMAAIAFNLKKYLKRGGGKALAALFGAIQKLIALTTFFFGYPTEPVFCLEKLYKQV
jgi:hypothetical protein